MNKFLLIIPYALCLTGCLNPNLCGIKEQPIQNKNINPRHVEYFEDKPNLFVEEAHGTILPIGHYRNYLQKRESGFRYVSNASLLGGLLLEGSSTANYDENGNRLLADNQSVSLNMLCGLLFDYKLSAHIDDVTGSYNKTYLFKSFGVAQEIGGSKYYTILWMPMRFSNQNMEPIATTPAE